MRQAVAGFLFLATLIAIVVAISLLFPGTFLDRIWNLNPSAYAAFHVLGKLSGVILLVLGVGTGTTAFGLLRQRRWAWWLALVLFSANGLGDLVNLLIGGDRWKSAAGTLIAAAFVFLLVRLPRH